MLHCRLVGHAHVNPTMRPLRRPGSNASTTSAEAFRRVSGRHQIQKQGRHPASRTHRSYLHLFRSCMPRRLTWHAYTGQGQKHHRLQSFSPHSMLNGAERKRSLRLNTKRAFLPTHCSPPSQSTKPNLRLKSWACSLLWYHAHLSRNQIAW